MDLLSMRHGGHAFRDALAHSPVNKYIYVYHYRSALSRYLPSGPIANNESLNASRVCAHHVHDIVRSNARSLEEFPVEFATERNDRVVSGV